MPTPSRAIEVDFPIESTSLATADALERKELKDPVNHAHRWWGRRPAAAMEAIVRAALAPAGADPASDPPPGSVVFDPMMGGGTTISVARALGLRAVGQDINPVAYRIVSAIHGGIDVFDAEAAFSEIMRRLDRQFRGCYETLGPGGSAGELVCYLWMLEVDCPGCAGKVPVRTQAQVGDRRPNEPRPMLCLPCCLWRGDPKSPCPGCGRKEEAPGLSRCAACGRVFRSALAARERTLSYRMAAKVLREGGKRHYMPVDAADLGRADVSAQLRDVSEFLPRDTISNNQTTSQILSWGCRRWADLYLPRQAAVLGMLAKEVSCAHEPVRSLLALTLSSAAEFNSVLCSYRGRGQGAIRPTFWAQFLRLEPIVAEAPLLAAPPVSGAVRTLFRNRLLRAIRLSQQYPGSASLRFGSSHVVDLPDGSVDAVVTDPPFGDSVNYDSLSDYFNAWHRVIYRDLPQTTTAPHQVQDGDPAAFAKNFAGVLRECARVLAPGAVACYTFTHSAPAMWVALVEAAEDAGLRIVRSHCVLTDASFSAISYRNEDRPQSNAVIVMRRREEVPMDPEESQDVAARAVAQGAAQLGRFPADFASSSGDLLTAAYGCVAARLGGVDRQWWLRAMETARDLVRSGSYAAMVRPAAKPEPVDQLSLF